MTETKSPYIVTRDVAPDREPPEDSIEARIAALERQRAADRRVLEAQDVLISDLRQRAVATTERVTELDNQVRVMAELVPPPVAAAPSTPPVDCIEGSAGLWALAKALVSAWDRYPAGGPDIRIARDNLTDYVREHS